MSDLQWWGYRHISGTLQAKRYWSMMEIDDARESPFVKLIYGPFNADGRDEALEILERNV